MRASWNNAIIAESEDIIEIEGNPYFPIGSIARQYFTESDTTTTCPWKGVASYFHIEVDGKVNEDAAWTYKEPKQGAEALKGRIAFWRGVEWV